MTPYIIIPALYPRLESLLPLLADNPLVQDGLSGRLPDQAMLAVAEIGDIPISCAFIGRTLDYERVPEDERRRYELKYVATHPEWRNRKISQQLISLLHGNMCAISFCPYMARTLLKQGFRATSYTWPSRVRPDQTLRYYVR